MKQILMLVLSLSATSAFAETVKAYDCQVRSSGNMKRLTLTLVQTGAAGAEQIDATVFFTRADSIISNRVLNGSSPLSQAIDGAINFAMDKDPYNGSVGTFFWSFRVPVNFINGVVPAEFGQDPSQIIAYKWQGTPSGAGNNSGLGFVDDWSCRSLN